jgi:hypothetical protein
MLNDWITLLTDNNKKQKNKTNTMELLDKLNWDTLLRQWMVQKYLKKKLTTSLKRSHLLFKWFTTFWGHCNYKSRSERKIRPISWNQSVVTDCSHLFVFAAWDTYTADRINKMFDLTNTIGIWKRRLGKLPSNAFKQLSAKGCWRKL